MAGYENLQQIAQVLKSNGTDGELVMGFREIAPEDINLNEPVFIIFDGLPVPFYIESFAKRGNTKALVRLTDICSMEDVEEIAETSPICSTMVANAMGIMVITEVISREASPPTMTENAVSFHRIGKPSQSASATAVKSTLPITAAST